MAWVLELFEEQDIDTLLRPAEAKSSAGERLLCVRCGETVTSASERIEVAGGHRHTFTNPAGLTFTIGCFAAAPGAVQSGTATAAWTWFEGYRWRYAHCRRCANHLGWSYHDAGGALFFGLILDRLVSPQ